MKTKLEAFIRKRQAQALEAQIASRDATWSKVLRNLDTIFPSKQNNNAVVLEEFGSQFKWGRGRGTMEIITETLHKLGIDEYERSHKSSDGELLFQLIRCRAPESIALNDMRIITLTWDELMRKLQGAYNRN